MKNRLICTRRLCAHLATNLDIVMMFFGVKWLGIMASEAGHFIFRQRSLRQVFQCSYVQGTRCFKMMVAVWSDALLYVLKLQMLWLCAQVLYSLCPKCSPVTVWEMQSPYSEPNCGSKSSCIFVVAVDDIVMRWCVMQTWETLAVPTAPCANDMKKVFPQGYVVPHSDAFNLNDGVHGKPGPRRIYLEPWFHIRM